MKIRLPRTLLILQLTLALHPIPAAPSDPPSVIKELVPEPGENAEIRSYDEGGYELAFLGEGLRERTPQLIGRLAKPLKAGDVVVVSFDLKKLTADDDYGRAFLDVALDSVYAGGPTLGSFRAGVFQPEWVHFQLPIQLSRDVAAGEVALRLSATVPAQRIAVKDIQLRRMPEGTKLRDVPFQGFSYPGREADAPWRQAAQARIEAIRKAPVLVEVRDAEGKPVAGAKVRVRQLRHAFPFGTAVSGSGLFTVGPLSDRYREEIPRLFNRAVLENDLKWPEWEAPGGRELALRSLHWLRDHGLSTRGHVMIWPSWLRTPPDLRGLRKDPAALQTRILEHIQDLGAATQGLVEEWDVVNEPRTHNDITNILGLDGMAEWFRAAKKANPGARLFLNEFDLLNASTATTLSQRQHEDLLRALLDRGAPLEGIADQAHFWGYSLTPPDLLVRILDRFGAFGLPIAITEFDVNVKDEQLQADYTRDFMTIIFSHPAVESFLMWGFWEKRHWLPDGAMFRADWTPKPNAKAYEKLVFHDWWTDETLVTDRDGRCRTRAFFGDYEIRADLGEKTAIARAATGKDGISMALHFEGKRPPSSDAQ